MKEARVKEALLFEAIKAMAPGTSLREGLENVLKAMTGALIVIGYSDAIKDMIDGGFAINVDFSPAYLYELCKMDGAIILSNDCRKILYANTQIMTDASIQSVETGTRHRTAERVAKLTGQAVIAISQKRHIITLYKGHSKYIVQDTNKILTKANQAIQTLEKYKSVLDQATINLSALEFEDLVTVHDVVTVIQRTEMVIKIVHEIEKYICELGSEGRLVNMQMEELVANVIKDGKYVIMDYNANLEIEEDEVQAMLHELSSEELLDLSLISKILGYGSGVDALDITVSTRGYRILNKIPRLPMAVIENLLEEFSDFQKILKASTEQLDDVEGIGEVRARAIKDGLRRLQEQVLLDRHI
ncbi:MAG TPA: DNA integrity scanning diadenylate cyclase DisA [Oscillospiraceae bacterium]|nr:DNA integrity scanning diadenylate cyclase DisA [Oscillospiraceae bacterium]